MESGKRKYNSDYEKIIENEQSAECRDRKKTSEGGKMNEIAEIFKKIQDAEIIWTETEEDPALFETLFEGEVFRLSLNDFPDEALFTIYFKNIQEDIEERPLGWVLRHKT